MVSLSADTEAVFSAMPTPAVSISASVSALNDTIAVAGGMVETAGQLKEHSGTIAQVLAQRAAEEVRQ